ncbi:MAG: site-specific DNA-methyltransferase [Terricaulis sp.]
MMILGNALDILPTLKAHSFDALITDPPYASGGQYRGDRAIAPQAKYQQSGTTKRYAGGNFAGDGMDQRSWMRWCTEWLRASLRCVRPGGYAMVFIDWRQLPAMTDAFQMAGWHWRGVIVWDKTESSRAPHKGYFRHQAEYIVWGTNGVCKAATHAGPFPGVYRHRVNHTEKLHITGKPIQLMRDLVKCTPPGSKILDPFAGSGTTIRAATAEGRRAVGIELSDECFEVARQAIKRAA